MSGQSCSLSVATAMLAVLFTNSNWIRVALKYWEIYVSKNSEKQEVMSLLRLSSQTPGEISLSLSPPDNLLSQIRSSGCKLNDLRIVFVNCHNPR